MNLTHTMRNHTFSLRVHGDRIYFSVAEFESDIWVMDLEWE